MLLCLDSCSAPSTALGVDLQQHGDAVAGPAGNEGGIAASIRVLVGAPDSPAVRMRAAELSLDCLLSRCGSTLRILRAVLGINVRPHQAVAYASPFRFDDNLLANTHAAGLWVCHSPVMQLRRTRSAELHRQAVSHRRS